VKLNGPANPDQFRVKVGRFRHYFDNLPGCDVAPATDATWPAVTSVKNAAGKDWSYVSLGRAAAYLADKRHELDGMDADSIYKRLVSINEDGLNKAGKRGTDVHALLEAKAAGEDRMLIASAEPYRAVVDQFIADCEPEWFLSEIVIINRTLGYGGTLDAGVILNHPELGWTLADWKTRRSAEQHAAYDEEGWQVGGAYLHGEYMIVEEDGNAVRRPLPKFDSAAIVSLAPEGYKVFPIKVEESWETFQRLYDFWASKQDKSFAGKPIYIPRSTPAPADPEQVAKLREAVEWIKAESPAGLQMLADNWPDGVPTFKAGGPTTTDQASLLAMLIERVKRDADVPFNPEPIEPEPAPDLPPAAEVRQLVIEGGLVSDDDLEDLRQDFDELAPELQAWIRGVAEQANAAKVSISVNAKPTQRRHAIVTGLVAIAPHGDDELLRALVALTRDDDQFTDPNLTAGSAVCSLSATEAAAFSALCEQYANGGLPTVVGEDGRLRVQRLAEVS
jgi:hypothetical protein